MRDFGRKHGAPADWNVLVSVYEHEFREAIRLLAPFGAIGGSEYRNVLVMKVPDVLEFLEALRNTLQSDASIANAVSKVSPVTDKFRFESPGQFEERSRAVVEQWIAELAGKTFHVRMHRRGFKGRLSSQDEERFLDHYALEQLQRQGAEARIDFDDPDLIVAVETLGQTAGLSRWTREQLRRFELLKLD